mgnify:CR=1 FL=1
MSSVARPRESFGARLIKNIRQRPAIYVMLLFVVAAFIIFAYVPMGGLIIAFQKYAPRLGIAGSKWVGFKWFLEFFNDMFFFRLIRNTFTINLLDILVGFPMPILLAVMMNALRSRRAKATLQTMMYLPYFISMIVICGIISDFCARDGIINDLIAAFGGQRTGLLNEPAAFQPIYVLSNLWQMAGWNSIIYMAAMSAIDASLYDAAYVDGCGKLRQMWHVTLPGILPTIIIMLILRIGNMFTVGYEKIILLYNPMTYETADVISSYVYRRGIEESNFSYATAIGLFNSVLNCVFLFAANALSRRATEQSLW